MNADDYLLEAPIVLHCQTCRYQRVDGSWKECVCPKQSGFDDLEGAQSFKPVSLVREFYCHGQWWEARLPDRPPPQRYTFWQKLQILWRALKGWEPPQ